MEYQRQDNPRTICAPNQTNIPSHQLRRPRLETNIHGAADEKIFGKTKETCESRNKSEMKDGRTRESGRQADAENAIVTTQRTPVLMSSVRDDHVAEKQA
jgi:hypothetical protein